MGAAPAVTGRAPGGAVGPKGAPVAVPAFPPAKTFEVAFKPALTAGIPAPPVASAGGAVTRAPAAGVTVVRVVTVFLLVTVAANEPAAAPAPPPPPSSMMIVLVLPCGTLTETTSCFQSGLGGGPGPGDLRSAAATPTGGGTPGENLRTWRSWATWFPNCSRRLGLACMKGVRGNACYDSWLVDQQQLAAITY
ncbi:hypothetical protein PG987_001042 [Apiospora arundinis]